MSQELSDVSTRMRASGRWAVGSLVLVALATSEISGLGTVVALPIAAVNAFLSALCHGDVETYNLITKTPRRFRASRHSGDLFEFFAVWLELLTQVAAVAACARVVSATVDYMSGGRASDWLLGYQSHSLGEPWPDLLGIAIVLALNLMFMLGLENSHTFFIILNAGTVGSLLFFLVLGCLYADLEFWKRDTFLPEGFVGMFTTAAMCSFGFSDRFPENEKKRRYRQPITHLLLIILVQLLTYIGITMLFTLMSYFRELVGTAVPLVRMFEARDVDWARPIMASFTIVTVAVALMEFCPAMFDVILELADRDWNVLTRSLLYENDTTGSPVLTIFATGSLSAILAFVCPLSYLVRLLNAGPLLTHILEAMVIVYYRYQPEDDVEDFPVCNDVEYSKLSQGGAGEPKLPSSGLKARILTGSWFLPKSMRKSRKDLTMDKKNYSQSSGKGGGGEEESEYLLMGTYSPEPQDVPLAAIRHSESNLDSDVSEEGNDLTTITAHSTDDEAAAASSSNSTDIDAIVQEYKERLKVATTLTGTATATVRLPSLATGRFVLGAVIGVAAWSAVLAVGVLYEKISVIGGALSGALILTAMICAQPQVRLEHTFNRPVSCSLADIFYSLHTCLVPLLPVTVIVLNTILAAMLIAEIWIGIVCWFLAGLILFARCEECMWCWDCVDPTDAASHVIINTRKEHRRSSSQRNLLSLDRLQTTSSTSSSIGPAGGHRRHIAHVDTILIAR